MKRTMTLIPMGFFAAMLVAGCAGAPEPASSAPTGSKEPSHREALAEGVTVEYVGEWTGALEVQGTEIGIVVRFLNDPAGIAPTATMDIPEQMASDLPLSEVSADGDIAGSAVHFELVTGGPKLIADGLVGEDGSIAGTFTQGPASGSFSLVRTGDIDASATNLPGTSMEMEARPAQFESTEVSLDRGIVQLAATLVEPLTPGPWPVMIIHAGSGPTDRDGNSAILPGPNNGLKMLAESLAARGIATLRYDKRGIAASTSKNLNPHEVNFGDLVNDLLAWVEWVENDDRFGSVSLAGHSEGSVVVLTAMGSSLTISDEPGFEGSPVDPRLAGSAREAVDALVLLAGPSKPVDLLALDQLRNQLGENAPLYERSVEIVDALRRGETVEDVPPELQALFNPAVQPYLRSLVPYDPATMIKNVNQPILIVGGTEDFQVPVSEIEILAAARTDAEVVILDGANHLLKEVGVGDLVANRSSYSNPSYALAADLVPRVAEFVNQQ